MEYFISIIVCCFIAIAAGGLAEVDIQKEEAGIVLLLSCLYFLKSLGLTSVVTVWNSLHLVR